MTTNLANGKFECLSTIHYFPLQSGLFVQSLISIGSLYTTFNFLEGYIRTSPIHRNFKFLLFAHFIRSFCHSIAFLGSSISVAFRAFGSDETENSEEIFINPTVYKYLHMFYAIVLNADATIKILLVIERTIATIQVKTYEKETNKWTCWVYVLISVIAPVTIISLVYQNADLVAPKCFAVVAPKETESPVNFMYYTSMTLSVLSLILLKQIILLNKKKLKVYNFQLSTRYQIGENLTGLKLVSTVLITGLSATLIHAILLMTLRLGIFPSISNNIPLLNAVKVWFYPLPLADMLIPLYSGYQVNKINQVKRKNVTFAISTDKSPKEARDTYEKMLKAQWG